MGGDGGAGASAGAGGGRQAAHSGSEKRPQIQRESLRSSGSSLSSHWLLCCPSVSAPSGRQLSTLTKPCGGSYPDSSAKRRLAEIVTGALAPGAVISSLIFHVHAGESERSTLSPEPVKPSCGLSHCVTPEAAL